MLKPFTSKPVVRTGATAGHHDPKSMAEAIQKLMEDRRLQTGGNNDLILPQAFGL